ncbi:MAG: glutathione S-transferase family protein [Caulobacteraceae bacterium]
MKLYYDPMSTTCRPVTLFLLDQDIPVEHEVVELFAGQHHTPEYTRVNPNQIVPFLVDGDFGLGESSAILKYVAEKIGSPTYPAELKARARVNEAMDWFNTQLHRDLCIFLVYPQVLPPGHLPEVDVGGLAAFGLAGTRRWLDVLDRHMIGENAYVCGDAITLADYLGVAHVTLAELIGFDFSPWPNVARWIATMKARPGWAAANAGFNGWIASRLQAAE